MNTKKATNPATLTRNEHQMFSRVQLMYAIIECEADIEFSYDGERYNRNNSDMSKSELIGVLVRNGIESFTQATDENGYTVLHCCPESNPEDEIYIRIHPTIAPDRYVEHDVECLTANIPISFHVSGGGGNRRRVEFINFGLGIGSVACWRYDGLIAPESDDPDAEWTDSAGNGVGMTQRMVYTGIGRCEIDGDYDTIYTIRLGDIARYQTSVHEAELKALDNIHYTHILIWLIENAIDKDAMILALFHWEF